MFANKPASGSDRNDQPHRGHRRHLYFERLEDRCVLDVQGLSTAADQPFVAPLREPSEAEVREMIPEPPQASLSSPG